MDKKDAIEALRAKYAVRIAALQTDDPGRQMKIAAAYEDAPLDELRKVLGELSKSRVASKLAIAKKQAKLDRLVDIYFGKFSTNLDDLKRVLKLADFAFISNLKKVGVLDTINKILKVADAAGDVRAAAALTLIDNQILDKIASSLDAAKVAAPKDELEDEDEDEDEGTDKGADEVEGGDVADELDNDLDLDLDNELDSEDLGGIAPIQEDIAEIKEDLSDVKEVVTEIKDDVTEYKELGEEAIQNPEITDMMKEDDEELEDEGFEFGDEPEEDDETHKVLTSVNENRRKQVASKALKSDGKNAGVTSMIKKVMASASAPSDVSELAGLFGSYPDVNSQI